MFCWKCGKPLKGKFCVFCGANAEEEIINEVPVAEESTDEFVIDDVDIAVGKMVSDEEYSIREQRYTREQGLPRKHKQARERNPIREEGHRRPHEGQRRPRPEPRAGQENAKEKGLKPLFILVPLLILALIVAGWAFMGMQSTRAFNDTMEQGNRYLLAMDLEQAEAHFLRAVEISPREVEPYLLLADVYVLQDEIELAIDILEQGMEAVSEEDREVLEDKLDEVIQGVQPEIVEEVDEAEEVGEVELVPHTPSVAYFNRILSEYQWAERGNFVCDFSQPWFRNDLLRFDDSHLYYVIVNAAEGTPNLFIAEVENGDFANFNIIGMYGIEGGVVQPLQLFGGPMQPHLLAIDNFSKNDGVRNPFIIRENGGISAPWNEMTIYYVIEGNSVIIRFYERLGYNEYTGEFHYTHAYQNVGDTITQEEYEQRIQRLEQQFPPIDDNQWLRLSTAVIDFGEGVDHDNPFAGILTEIDGIAFMYGLGGRSHGEWLRIDKDGLLSGWYWCNWSWEDNNGEDITSLGRVSVDEKIDDFTYKILLLEYQRIGLFEGHDKVAGETLIYLFLPGRDISEDWSGFTRCSVTVAHLRYAMGLEGYTEHHGIAQYELPISLPFHALRIRFSADDWTPYIGIRDEESNEETERLTRDGDLVCIDFIGRIESFCYLPFSN